MKIRTLFILTVLAGILLSCSTRKEPVPAIIPQPVSVTQSGGVFALSPSATIRFTGRNAEKNAIFLAEMLRPASGYKLPVSPGTGGTIRIAVDSTRVWKSEEYSLIVGKGKIELIAGSSEGLFRGIQTIRQLLPAEIEKNSIVKGVEWIMPCVNITDYPRFAWRGMHLDVSRHFFDVPFIKRYIDLIAMHKMNVFHWHLVDDQGWRIEIKKYPKLTEVGAWRVDREDKTWGSRPPQKPGEKATYGGFYTQEQIKEIVAYAAERHITVVPEIEMPAHVMSALAAYPEYSCTGKAITVPPGSVWPITEIYCAGKDETFTFLENILTEVIDLFPSEYIHIGGDEATKTEWKKCPLCQARIRKEGLKDESELQSYFIKRIEKFVNSKGRQIIGWDEILEGGLAPGAAVMSWRGVGGGIAAAKTGHKVVMTPESHLYFNYYQADPSTEPVAYGGYLTLKKVYTFEPVPAELSPEEAKYIIGAQGNLWGEFVSSGRQAEYQVVPRMTALSEVLWSKPESRNWDDFNKRLMQMTKRFDNMGINYSKGSYRVGMSAVYDTTAKAILVRLSSEQQSPEIRYTTDGSEPESISTLYKEPFLIKSSVSVKAAIFVEGKRMGNISEKTLIINKSTGRKVKINIPFSDKYRASGESTLVNGIKGSIGHDDGQWLGFEGTNMDVVIDLGSEIAFTKISAGFLANVDSWIFLPQWVEFSVSSDSKSFSILGKTINKIDPADQGKQQISLFWTGPETKGRFIRVFAKGLGVIPKWHEGAGGRAWLFSDEISVE
jgi:hexosaminidase